MSCRVTCRLLPTAVFPFLAPMAQPWAQQVRDSAGVQIVDNTRPLLSAAQTWRVDPDPMISIGGISPDGDSLFEFALIMGVSRLSDGRFAVGVQGSHAVRFYDARGSFVGSAGRKGEGPGEFQQIMGTRVIRGDTIFVSDQGQVEYFTADGRFARQGASRARGPGFVWPAVPLHDGSYLGVHYGPPSGTPPPAGRSRYQRTVVRVSRDGQQVDTVGSLASEEQIFDGRQAFGTQIVFSRGGVLAGDEERLFLGDGARSEILEYTITGAPTRVVRLPRSPRRVTNEARNAYREYVRTSPGEDGRPMPPAMRARFDQMLERTTFADEFPYFGDLIVDRTGHLWAQQYDYRSVFRTPGPVRTHTLPVASHWNVFDRAGRWLCTVDLPARFTPSEIGTDYVAGMARDTDDVEQVRVYRLRKPQGGAR